MNEFDRLFERFWNDLWAQRIVLAFTVGMFLTCSAEIASGQAPDSRTQRREIPEYHAPAELVGGLTAIGHTKPLPDTELAFAKSGITRGLPLAFETVPQLAGGAATILLENPPLNYHDIVVDIQSRQLTASR